MNDTTLNPIDNSAVTVATVESPSVLAPQISERDAFAMPIDDLKKAAFDQPAPTPVAQHQTTPEPYTLTQEGNTFVLKYATGEVFKGGSEIEAYRKAAENAVRNIEYAKQLKNQLAAQPQPQQLPDPAMMQQQQSPEEVQRDAARFLQSLVLTPEIKQQIVAEAIGVDPRALPGTVQGIASTVKEFQSNNLMIDFHARCPEYLDTPENTNALLESLANVLGVNDPQQLSQVAYPSVDKLETAYARAVYKGTITPHKQQAQQVQVPRPPIMPSATAPQFGGDQSAWTMPLDELKRRAGI